MLLRLGNRVGLFFVDALGRVTCAPLLAHAKVPDVLPPPDQVVWMTWAEGLAAVWEDEAARLESIAHVSRFVPDLAQAVAALRDGRLRQL